MCLSGDYSNINTFFCFSLCSPLSQACLKKKQKNCEIKTVSKPSLFFSIATNCVAQGESHYSRLSVGKGEDLQFSAPPPAPCSGPPGAPWRETPRGNCPQSQRGPGVNNLYETLLVLGSLQALDALPLLLLLGDSICPLPSSCFHSCHPSFHPHPPWQNTPICRALCCAQDTEQIPAPVTSLIILARTNWVYWGTFLQD